MNCPTDGATLVMSDRAGVEIDYCPQCRGVWLDRGELDKIIERSNIVATVAPRPVERRDDDDRYRKSYDDDDYKKKKKKEKKKNINTFSV